MSRRRSVRITPLGYIVLVIIILVMVVGIYFIVWSMSRNKTNEQGTARQDPYASITPTPSLAPVSEATTSVQTTAPVAETATQAPVVTPVPVEPDMTPKPDDTPTPEVKTPSPEQVKNALDGTLKSSGVVLRKGPSTSYDRLGTYSSGTQLKIYEASGDYYFVQIVKENKYGYMAIKFIEKEGLLPGETATPVPEGPSGTINGVVSASLVALRDAPSTESNRIGEAANGAAVYIYFKTGDFYYIQVVKTKVMCYAYAEYIKPESAVPSGTPVP